MKRISEILQSVEPHPLLKYSGVTTATTSVSSSAFPRAIKRLQTVEFNYEINAWINNEIINTNLDRVVDATSYLSSDDDESPSCESTIEDHLLFHIVVPCRKIIKRGICDGFILTRAVKKSGADFCLRNRRYREEPLFIEVKTPLTMSVAEHIPEIIKERSNLNNLVHIHQRAKVDTNIHEGNASKILRQIWLYLQDSCCQYAILTNGLSSIFVRRTSLEPDVLLISEPFSNSSLTDSLSILARYSYFCWKARGAAPIPFIRQNTSSSPSPSDDTYRDPDFDGTRDDVDNAPDNSGGDSHARRSKRLKVDVTRVSQASTNQRQQDSVAFPLTPTSTSSSSITHSHQLITRGVFHRGNYSTVRNADYDGRKVVAKLSYPEEESIQILRQEGEKYKKLKQLQGKVIPRVLAQFTDELGMFVIVMEPLLRIETWTQETVDKACASLTALHELGYVHGDISRSNFMQDENGDVFVIDLEHAKWSEKIDAHFTGEHDQVKKFLQSE